MPKKVANLFFACSDVIGKITSVSDVVVFEVSGRTQPLRNRGIFLSDIRSLSYVSPAAFFLHVYGLSFD